jgi:uncharacterized protein (UPF0248 family)
MAKKKMVIKPKQDFYYDAVGRRRKLSAGAMKDIQRQYADGIPSADLAAQYSVSRTTITNVVYSTIRKTDIARIQKWYEAHSQTPVPVHMIDRTVEVNGKWRSWCTCGKYHSPAAGTERREAAEHFIRLHMARMEE